MVKLNSATMAPVAGIESWKALDMPLLHFQIQAEDPRLFTFSLIHYYTTTILILLLIMCIYSIFNPGNVFLI